MKYVSFREFVTMYPSGDVSAAPGDCIYLHSPKKNLTVRTLPSVSCRIFFLLPAAWQENAGLWRDIQSTRKFRKKNCFSCNPVYYPAPVSIRPIKRDRLFAAVCLLAGVPKSRVWKVPLTVRRRRVYLFRNSTGSSR